MSNTEVRADAIESVFTGTFPPRGGTGRPEKFIILRKIYYYLYNEKRKLGMENKNPFWGSPAGGSFSS